MRTRNPHIDTGAPWRRINTIVRRIAFASTVSRRTVTTTANALSNFGNAKSTSSTRNSRCRKRRYPNVVEIKFPADWTHTAQPSCGCGCSELDTAEVVGWCLHCAHVYADYSPEIQDRHFARCCPGRTRRGQARGAGELGTACEKTGPGCKW